MQRPDSRTIRRRERERKRKRKSYLSLAFPSWNGG
jgi:hypothetical protein